MSLLSIDQSLTRSGWALIPGTRLIREELSTGSFVSIDPMDFAEKFLALVRQLQPHQVVFERPLNVIMTYGKKQLAFAGGGKAVTPNADQLKLHRIAGMIEGICLTLDIPCHSVAPQTWRKSVLGNGNIPRAETKAAAIGYCRRIGIDPKHHDIAEAICLSVYGISSLEYRYSKMVR